VTVLLPLVAPAQERLIVRPADGPAYCEGRLLIIPKAGREAALNRFHGQGGARLRKAFPRLGNIQVVELPRGVPARAALARYEQSGYAASVELDYCIAVSALPNDPGVLNGRQWHLHNTGQDGGLADADLDAPEAWDILRSASNIVVAVIDSGIHLTHRDLTNNLWINPGEIAGNGLDDDGNGIVDDVHGFNAVNGAAPGHPQDDFGHGTHVAGIIGATGNNGAGVSGVAWQVRLMACKFLDNFGNGALTDLVDCLDYALTNGAHLLNCSFESPVAGATLSNAFWGLRSAGLLVAAAAGNSGTDNDAVPKYPASFAMDNIVAVTATTRTDGQAYNYGANSVDLGAPGVSLYSTRQFSDTAEGVDSGTSYAAPCVAGAMALLKSKYPNLSYQQVIARLLGTVDPLPSLAGRCVTGGRLNLARALSGGFDIQPAAYAWVPTNGMNPLMLADDGISAARALPFTFAFGGRGYTNLYVGANGILGFIGSGLGLTANMDMPTASVPNAIVCPLWDNLNPAAGGNVWWGTSGVEPYRSVVVSWVDVPHFVTAGGQTRFTFQALLHESGGITFQYASVQTGHPNYVRGQSATIGLEDFSGAVAAKYSYNGEQAVMNNQAILFRPHGAAPRAPLLKQIVGPQGQFQLQVVAQLGQRCVLKASEDLSSWTSLATNVIPASGVWEFTDASISGRQQRFYQAASEP
jgi:subtilisin family serine protease